MPWGRGRLEEAPMYTVDIDTGGTMTDGLVSDGADLVAIKVDTTPHDYTVSFRQVLAEAARRLGFGDDLGAFLDQVSVIRWSSTITSNVIGERKGARVGVLARRGNERDLYGQGVSPVVGTLVAEHDLVGLPDDADEQAVLEGVRRLFENGARRICVALDTFPDQAPEQRVKKTVERQYPDHFLGAVPVLLGSEMAQVGDAATRAHAAVINAYVHSQLASSLFKAEDLLRYDEGWSGPLLVGHTNGGVARVGKTKAVDTIESGPVFGTHGAAWYARRYGLGSVVCLDVGGTTAKASLVESGQPRYTRDGDIFGIPLRTPLALLRSAVLGGGSVARPEGGGVRLGPDSMGAAPGPACYGLGGDQATLTDAFLVLGYLDPGAFLDGRRTLDVEAAREVLQRRVADPLGAPLAEVARRIVDAAFGVVAELVGSTLARAGIEPERAALFAYGGNGGLFAAPVAERLGMATAHVFALGPVLSTFGSAVSDVLHVYERTLGMDASDVAVDQAVTALTENARRDLAGEGFDPDGAELEVERDGGGRDGRVDVVRVRARQRLESLDPPARAAGPAGATAPPSRTLLLPDGSSVDAPVLDWATLGPGTRLDGPALAAGGSMTCLVPPGWALEVDQFGDAVLGHGDR
jgi:N-methylhydantoinase A/oxoprolinase/acetone carboxylase beta subunit